MRLISSLIVVSSLSMLSPALTAQVQSKSPSKSKIVTAAQTLSVAPLARNRMVPLVQESILRPHLAYLSDDLLEGRGTGQRGGDLTVRYLETQAALLGLQRFD